MLLHELNVRCEFKPPHREHGLSMSIPRSARNSETITLILKKSDIFQLFRDWRDINNWVRSVAFCIIILGTVLGRFFHAPTIHADHIIISKVKNLTFMTFFWLRCFDD